MNDSTKESPEGQVQFKFDYHLDQQDLASGEVIEALADPGIPAQELTSNEVIEALIDPNDPLGVKG